MFGHELENINDKELFNENSKLISQEFSNIKHDYNNDSHKNINMEKEIIEDNVNKYSDTFL